MDHNAAVDSFEALLLVILALGAIGGLSVVGRSDKARRLSLRFKRVRSHYGPDGEDEEVMDEERGRSPVVSLIHRNARRLFSMLARVPITVVADSDKLYGQLRSIGFEERDTLQTFTALKLLLAAALALLAVLFPFTEAVFQGAFAPLSSVLIAALVGLRLPHWLLAYAVYSQRAEINELLPDAIDLLCICTNAGYGIDLAIERVARDMERIAPVVARQFAITSRDLKLLPDRQVALRRFSERVKLPAVDSLVATVIQSQILGTPITAALKILANAERSRRLAQIEEKAAKLPAQITVPIILFILPTIFLVIGGPAAVQVIRQLGM